MKHMIYLALIALAHPAAFAETKTWALDPGHSSIAFRINHLKFSNVQGLIPNLEGSVVLDEAKAENSTFDIKVAAGGIFTGNPKREDHLKSPDFFNVKQFPEITLKSKSVKKKGEAYDVKADLTMHGVTKPVSFVFKRGTTGKDPWGNMRTGGGTSFKVKRTDFGVSFMSKPGEIGEDVDLSIELEAVQK